MADDARASRTMKFGRYRGARLVDISTPYLPWVAQRPDLRPPLSTWVHDELAAREQHQRGEPEPRPMIGPVDRARAEQVVEVRCERLATQFHPDRGGTNARMRDLLDVREWLRDAIGAADLVGAR
jgi:hypothetical protein